MCTPDTPCECFDRGSEDLADGILAWANGDHGDTCRCITCHIAITIMMRGLPRLVHILRQHREERQAPPPAPGEEFHAGGLLDF